MLVFQNYFLTVGLLDSQAPPSTTTHLRFLSACSWFASPVGSASHSHSPAAAETVSEELPRAGGSFSAASDNLSK